MVLGISHNRIEIDDFVEYVARPDPLVHSLPGILAQSVRKPLYCVVGRTEWCNRCCKHGDTKSVDAGNNLLVGLNHAVPCESLVLGRRICGANIVHTLKYHGIFYTG